MSLKRRHPGDFGVGVSGAGAPPSDGKPVTADERRRLARAPFRSIPVDHELSSARLSGRSWGGAVKEPRRFFGRVLKRPSLADFDAGLIWSTMAEHGREE